MKQILKEGKVRGSVLFTVVAVMMVMVVFLMSTLVLTSSANRRSYYTYYETQAQYAAQAALDAVTNSAYTDGDFYTWVVRETENARVNGSENPFVTVNFTDSDIQFTNADGAVQCVIEQATPTLVWDELTQAVHEQKSYKITATASVGRGRNRSEYTVCNYIYENYRVEDPERLPSVSNTASNTVHSWNRVTNPSNNPLNPGVPKAVYSFGKAGTTNNMQYFGPQYSNMGTIPFGRLSYDSHEDENDIYMSKLSNDNHCVGNSVIVSNYFSSVLANAVFQDFGEYSMVYGNLYGSQPGKGFFYQAEISSEIRAKKGVVPYTQTPFVYVDGVVNTKFNNGSIVLGYDEEWEAGDSNVNLYCGGVQVGNGNSGSLIVRGDVFMYDPAINSVWGGGTANSDKTRLSYFVDNNVNGLDTAWDTDIAGGTIVSNNKKLSINVSMDIPGDLIFTNKAGTLEINSSITVGGKVLCAGTLVGAGNISCDTIVTSSSAKVGGVEITQGIEVTGLDLAPFNKTNDEGNAYFDYYAFLYDNYADSTVYGKYLGTDDSTFRDPNSEEAIALWDSYKAEGYQQALMPYSMRLDEIFETYYRWDLKAETQQAAMDKVAGDFMAKESSLTGHIWGAKKFTLAEPTLVVDSTKIDTITKYVFDEEAKNLDQSAYDIVYPLTQDWNTVQTIEGGAGHYAAIGYKIEAEVPDQTHLSYETWVPYVTSRSGNNFAPTYSPITNDSEISAALGDQMITSVNTFTTGMSTAKKYTCGSGSITRNIGGSDIVFSPIGESSLIRANVPVGYHDTDEGNTWRTDVQLDSAYVIKESCYIDLGDAVTTGNLRFLVDPTGHDASDPIKIVLSGSGQCAGLFVINNTSYYATDYKSITSAYAARNVVAPKGAVQIFFADGFYTNNLLQVYTSGLYPFATSGGVSYQQASGEFHIVSNPIYPNDPDKRAIWENLDSTIKYSYEYVPNAMVYGEAGAYYDSQNGAVLNAIISMPKSGYNATNANQYKATVHYREQYDSTEYTKGEYSCFGIGSVVCDNITTGSNVASVVYIGDAYNSGLTEIVENPNILDDERSSKLGRDNVEYFSNDYQGAN